MTNLRFKGPPYRAIRDWEIRMSSSKEPMMAKYHSNYPFDKGANKAAQPGREKHCFWHSPLPKKDITHSALSYAASLCSIIDLKNFKIELFLSYNTHWEICSFPSITTNVNKYLLPIDKDFRKVKTTQRCVSLRLYVPIIYQETSSLVNSKSNPTSFLFFWIHTSVLLLSTWFAYKLVSLPFTPLLSLDSYKQSPLVEKFLWMTHCITNTIGGRPLNCGQQRAEASSEENSSKHWQRTHTETCRLRHIIIITTIIMALNILLGQCSLFLVESLWGLRIWAWYTLQDYSEATHCGIILQ